MGLAVLALAAAIELNGTFPRFEADGFAVDGSYARIRAELVEGSYTACSDGSGLCFVAILDNIVIDGESIFANGFEPL